MKLSAFDALLSDLQIIFCLVSFLFCLFQSFIKKNVQRYKEISVLVKCEFLFSLNKKFSFKLIIQNMDTSHKTRFRSEFNCLLPSDYSFRQKGEIIHFSICILEHICPLF